METFKERMDELDFGIDSKRTIVIGPASYGAQFIDFANKMSEMGVVNFYDGTKITSDENTVRIDVSRSFESEDAQALAVAEQAQRTEWVGAFEGIPVKVVQHHRSPYGTSIQPLDLSSDPKLIHETGRWPYATIGTIPETVLIPGLSTYPQIYYASSFDMENPQEPAFTPQPDHDDALVYESRDTILPIMSPEFNFGGDGGSGGKDYGDQ